MAENVILEMSKTFILKMSSEDMEQMACICTAKKVNYFDVVVACYHAGLVLLTEQCKCNVCRSSKHDEAKTKTKKNRIRSKNPKPNLRPIHFDGG